MEQMQTLSVQPSDQPETAPIESKPAPKEELKIDPVDVKTKQKLV